MSKLTVVGDPHITHKSLDRGAGLFYLAEETGQTCVWLGDMLDTKEVIRGKCLNFLYDQFSASSLNHIVLVGNHDWFNLECKDHALRVLQDLKNVQVIDTPTLMGKTLFIPYMHDLDKVRAVLDQYRDPNVTVVGHFDVSEFDYGNGHFCTNGLTLEDFRGYKRVISGHFHKYQNRGILTYLGTPFSHSFGETNQTKYIATYDTDTDELALQETPFPKHLTIELNCDEESTFTIAIDQLPDEMRLTDFHRIILTGTQAHIDQFPRTPFEKHNVKWITRPSDHAENNVTIDETVSNESQFTKWAKDVRKMDEETLKLGLEILEACK